MMKTHERIRRAAIRTISLVAMLMFTANVHGQVGDGDANQDVDAPTIQELMREGQQQISDGDTEGAIKTYKTVLDQDKSQDTAWHMLGYALHMAGQLDEAIKAHAKAAESSNQQISNLGNYNLACAYSLQNKTEKAIVHLNKIINNGYRGYQQMKGDSDLHNLAADHRFAKILAQSNNDEYLVENIEKAEKKIAKQDLEAAAEIYQTLYEQDDSDPFFTYRLGYCLHGAGKLDEALEFHKKAAKYPGVNKVATYNIGCIHALKGEKDEAFKAFDQAVELGFAQAAAFENDPDLESIRKDERFAPLLEKARAKGSEVAADSHNHDDDENEEHEGDSDSDHADDDDDEDGEQEDSDGR